MSAPAGFTHSIVENEGCPIHYYQTGTGPLFVFIPGGGGIARYFFTLIPYLSSHYTCVTFDRRQSGLSIPTQSVPFNPVQQARDAIAVIKDLGHSKANIFGSSGGAIIAMQLAASYPEYVDRMMVHEAPTICLLPDATTWIDRTYHLYAIYKSSGMEAAQEAFQEWLIGYDDFPRTNPSREDFVNFWEYEFTWITLFTPNLERVKENGVKIAVSRGAKSADAMYARTTEEHGKRLGVEVRVFPGHHQGYQSESEAFAKELLKVFEELGQT
jgi:pimeloyl-ACP methyl ester carboxylesterase